MAMKDPYEYTDKVIAILNRKAIKRFRQSGSDLLFLDELNVLKYTTSMYHSLLEDAKKYYLILAREIYKRYGGNKKRINMAWVNKRLSAYDDVTMYVFLYEVDRKAQRYAESMIASGTATKYVNIGLRTWTDMVNQYADTLTFDALVDAYKDSGVKEVMWKSEKDERVCHTCYRMDGTVYPINKIPDKPHWRCRCTVIPR